MFENNLHISFEFFPERSHGHTCDCDRLTSFFPILFVKWDFLTTFVPESICNSQYAKKIFASDDSPDAPDSCGTGHYGHHSGSCPKERQFVPYGIRFCQREARAAPALLLGEDTHRLIGCSHRRPQLYRAAQEIVVCGSPYVGKSFFPEYGG